MAQIAKIEIPATGRIIELPTGLFINNEFVPSVDSCETLRCVISRVIKQSMMGLIPHSPINPATEQEICQIVAGLEFGIFGKSSELTFPVHQRLRRISTSL